MRSRLAFLCLFLALPAGADSLRLSVGARVLDRCWAAPTAVAAGLRCRAAPHLAAHYEFLRTTDLATVTILF